MIRRSLCRALPGDYLSRAKLEGLGIEAWDGVCPGGSRCALSLLMVNQLQMHTLVCELKSNSPVLSWQGDIQAKV